MTYRCFSQSRRLFVKQGGVAAISIAAGATTGYAAQADAPTSRIARNSKPATHRSGAFASSFLAHPRDFQARDIAFSGKLPDALHGVLYRNGPALMRRGGTQYQHWFDGDGMVHAFTLRGNRLSHRAAMVRTDRYQAEEAAGRFLWNGFGTSIADSRPIQSPDTLNVANTSVLPMGNEVLALWEAGSAWRLRADNLDTIGRHVMSEDTNGMPFSAHPKVDVNGTIWNFGYLSGTGKLALYRLSRTGQLRQIALINAPNADMVHDFAITSNYLVFVLMPLRFRGDAGNLSFMERLHWETNKPVHVVLIGKNSLRIEHRFELPAFFAFHLGNAWEDKQNIHIEVARSAGFDTLMKDIVRATRGEPVIGSNGHGAVELVLNTTSKHATMQALPTPGVEFPRYDQRRTGLRTNQLFMLGISDDTPTGAFGFNTVCAMDRRHDNAQVFSYGPDYLAEEHVFVPEPSAPVAETPNSTGWLLGTAYNWRRQQTELLVFNARHVADGPVARATLPYGLPIGLHGQFVAVSG